MTFRPDTNQELLVGDVIYRVAEHPAAPGIPYGQEGRQAIVYQLISPSPSQGEGRGGGPDRRALKVFKPRYRLPEMVSVAEHIAPYAGLPGLQVCRRTVLIPQRHAPLLRLHPDLTYEVLMPWIEGPTWMEVLGEKRALSPAESLALARSLAGTLAEMEQKGLAHCDLSGSNVMLPVLAQSGSVGQAHFVELVDVEQIYSSDLKRPELLPGGSPGYAHKTAPQGLWSATADRFAGAVLLAEMLGWCDERVRDAAWGENYFDPQEVQGGESERYRLLVDVMRQTWGAGAARLFERAWRSDVLNDCATFGEWLVTLPEEVPVVEAAPPAEEAEGEQDKALENEGTIQTLIGLARQFDEQGNLESALQTYRQAQALAPTGSGLAEELTLVVQDVEARQAQTAVPEPEPPVEEVEAEPPAVEPQPVEGAVEESAAPAPQSALEAELALIEQGKEEEQKELPAPGLELPPEEVEAAEVAPLPPVDEETDLDGLFDNGLAAYRREEWAKARELLAEVVRRQPGYARDGRKASSLLAEAERQLAPPRRRVPGWAWALGGLAVLALAVAAILGVAVAIGSIGQTVVREVEVTATPTVVEVTTTPRPVAIISPENVDRVALVRTLYSAGFVESVTFDSDGTLLAWSGDGGIWVYDVRADREIAHWSGHTAQVHAVRFGYPGVFLISGGVDTGGGRVRFWDDEYAEIRSVRVGPPGWGVAIDFSPDNNFLATSSAGELQVWNVQDMKPLWNTTQYGGSPIFSSDGRKVASMEGDGEALAVYDATTGEILDSWKLPRLSNYGPTPAFAPDGDSVATGAGDNTVRVFRADGSVLVMKGHTRPVWSVTFSPDGNLLASAGSDGDVRLWNTVDGSLLCILQGSGVMDNVAFSPDGTLLASGSDDGTVRLWGVR